MLKNKKSVAKSVRMTEKVADYIQSFEGDGFNQKFENLVLFCMETEESRRHELEFLESCIADRQSVLYDRLRNIGQSLEVSARAAIELQRCLESVVRDLPGDAEQ